MFYLPPLFISIAPVPVSHPPHTHLVCPPPTALSPIWRHPPILYPPQCARGDAMCKRDKKAWKRNRQQSPGFSGLNEGPVTLIKALPPGKSRRLWFCNLRSTLGFEKRGRDEDLWSKLRGPWPRDGVLIWLTGVAHICLGKKPISSIRMWTMIAGISFRILRTHRITALGRSRGTASSREKCLTQPLGVLS